MSDFTKVDTQQVGTIASDIERMNGELYDLLEESKTTIKGLSSTWEGSASDATIQAYESFAQKYFSDYREILNAYVQFLRTNVDTGYVETETSVENLAEQFK